MKVLHLTLKKKDKIVIIDESDWFIIKDYKWMVVRNRRSLYAVAWDKSVRPRKQIKMHRLIMGVSNPKIFVDHRDNNGLNNTRQNIRVATPSQNKMNVSASGKSKYLGVTITKFGKYRAAIVVGKKFIHLGNFEREENAAKVRDEASKKYFGEFARLNFK